MDESRDQLREFYRKRNEAFLGQVDAHHIDEVIGDIIALTEHMTEITLVISSPGGETMAGFKLAQFLEQEISIPMTARVWGQCSSAATYPLLCCQKRVAHPQATFVLHRQTSGVELEYGDKFRERVKEWVSDNKAIHQQQVCFYSRKLSLKKAEVEEILLRGMGIDAAMSAKKALKLGLITDISQL